MVMVMACAGVYDIVADDIASMSVLGIGPSGFSMERIDDAFAIDSWHLAKACCVRNLFM